MNRRTNAAIFAATVIGVSLLQVGADPSDGRASASEQSPPERVGGSNRFETAALLSAEVFPSADTVVVTSGEKFADALVGTLLAAESNAPILLVRKGEIPPPTLTELGRIAPTRILLLGGPAVVDETVEGRLGQEADVVRISGATRVETAVMVSKALRAPAAAGGLIHLVPGDSFERALVTSAAAAQRQERVLLYSRSAGLSDALLEEIRRLAPSELRIGGAEDISQLTRDQFSALDAELSSTTVSYSEFGLTFDAEAFATGAAQDQFTDRPLPVSMLATISDYPDALAAGAAAAQREIPLLVTQASCLSVPTARYARDHQVDQFFVVGGPAAVSEAAARRTPCGVVPPLPAISLYHLVASDASPNPATTVAFVNAAQEMDRQLFVQHGDRFRLRWTNGSSVKVIQVPHTSAELSQSDGVAAIGLLNDFLSRTEGSNEYAAVVQLAGPLNVTCGRANTFRAALVFQGSTGGCGASWQVLTHEVLHLLGAVPRCSPNFLDIDHGDLGGHSRDPRDIMGDGEEIDPGADDYYRHGRTDCRDTSQSLLIERGRQGL